MDKNIKFVIHFVTTRNMHLRIHKVHIFLIRMKFYADLVPIPPYIGHFNDFSHTFHQNYFIFGVRIGCLGNTSYDKKIPVQIFYII